MSGAAGLSFLMLFGLSCLAAAAVQKYCRIQNTKC